MLAKVKKRTGEGKLPLPTAREVLQRAVTLATDEELDALLQQR